VADRYANNGTDRDGNGDDCTNARTDRNAYEDRNRCPGNRYNRYNRYIYCDGNQDTNRNCDRYEDRNGKRYHRTDATRRPYLRSRIGQRLSRCRTYRLGRMANEIDRLPSSPILGGTNHFRPNVPD
jgi:hypothetical protein